MTLQACAGYECTKLGIRRVEGVRMCRAHAVRVEVHNWPLERALSQPMTKRRWKKKPSEWDAAIDAVLLVLGERWAETELLEAVAVLRKS